MICDLLVMGHNYKGTEPLEVSESNTWVTGMFFYLKLKTFSLGRSMRAASSLKHLFPKPSIKPTEVVPVALALLSGYLKLTVGVLQYWPLGLCGESQR